jgi:transglutaminase-like putative cysteine protease
VAEAPFIPPRSTVVLFPSLAGDLESERTFNAQLEALVEIVGKTEAARLVLISEAADSTRVPARLKVERVTPSKAEFLNAAARLVTTNHVVVIAWGHGGMQGQTPVFHVRGPRLTASDFKQFAETCAKGPSTGVLMFRGSGRFAAELAASQRRIISSEKDSAFRNDPIAMAVFIKLLRANPAATFRTISDALGPAIAAWYDGQNLARTEEPTLWAGSSPPQALVAATPLLENGAPPAKEIAPSLPREQVTTNVTSWEVNRVKPSDYPDADSVILKRRITYTLAANPAVASEYEEYVQVLTPEGKEAGDFDISYAPPLERLEFLDCEVQRPDGSVLRINPDEIREADDASDPADESRSRRKFFSMPDVTPGAVIHVRYTREWQKFPLPHVTLRLPLADDVPARDTILRVTFPKDTAFHYRLEHVATQEPEIRESDYSSTCTWRFPEIAAWNAQLLSLPESRPALLISTFPDWKTFAGWYERIIRLADQSSLEITNKAVECTRQCKSESEKVVALYNYVTGLRYVAVPLGVNSFRPHAATAVLRNQYGDCKDKANLFNALLRSQGIDAHLVLVPRFGQAYSNLPGFAFNHALSRVRLGGQTLWLDTTDDICRFGMLPPGDAGRRVLVIDGTTDGLTELPQPKAKDHVFDLTMMVDISDLRSDAPAKISVTTRGYGDYSLRAAGRVAGRSKSIPVLSSEFALANGLFALTNQKFTSPSQLDRGFLLEMEGTLIGICEREGSDAVVRSAFWMPAEWMVALHQRDAPLFLNEGYPLLLKQSVEIKLPPDSSPSRLPPRQESTDGPLRWSLSWQRGFPTDSAGKYVAANLECELLKPELSREETVQFQKQARELFNALARTATFDINKK